MSINRTLLAAFHSVAASGSFTAAAHAQNVSQSTLSVHVGRLEKAYGCRLFLRQGRRIELTEIGRALYDLTARQFEAEQEAEALLTGGKGGLFGHLRIGAVSSNGIVGYLKTLLVTHPEITFSLDLSNSQHIIRDIADGNLDVGVIGFPISDPRIEKIPLSREKLVAVVGPKHEWVSRQHIDFSNLAEQTLILREQGSRTRQLIEKNLAALQVTPLRVIEINEWAALRELVHANLGVSIVPESEASSLSDDSRIQFRDLQMDVTQFLIYREDRRALSTLSSFLEIVSSDKTK